MSVGVLYSFLSILFFGVSFVEIDLRKRWQTNAQHGILECMLAECHGAADSLSLRIWFKS